MLIDTVARLQRDLNDMRAESRYLRTPGNRHVIFTSTKVPRFAGMTSWEQYRQVFDAIVLSNGWDDATVALQLFATRISSNVRPQDPGGGGGGTSQIAVPREGVVVRTVGTCKSLGGVG